MTYNSQKREVRAFQQPGGGGLVDDHVLLSGALQQRLNEIYNMSDDEDETVINVGLDDVGTIQGAHMCQPPTVST